MIENLPNWIELVFGITTVLTIIFFYLSNGKPKLVTTLIIAYSLIQAILAYSGFYQVVDSTPPRFALILLPTTLVLLFAFRKKQINWAIENRNYHLSTFLHIIRIPVEVVLLYLFFYKMIPELMTFEGRNFDILAGISSPIIGLLFLKSKISKKGVIIWNIISLLLVSFILVNGILSAELPIQQFAFDQPNRALVYFPFIWLPSTVVPIVIYTHVIDIIKLRRELKA